MLAVGIARALGMSKTSCRVRCHRHGFKVVPKSLSVQIMRMSAGTSQGPTVLEKMCNFLQSFYGSQEHGVLSIESKCLGFCQMYNALPISDKKTFLCHLADQYGANQESIVTIAQQVVSSQERGEATLLKVEERMRGALTARYQTLFSNIGRVSDGVKFLVDMRSDVLMALQCTSTDLDKAHLQALQSALRELLALWFTVGFLNLERITWESPCDMVQKISDYEAVHPIRSWADLKRRVGPYRRCFVFTHMSMPKEPVVVLHTALTHEISSSIHSIIGHPRFSGSLSPASDTSVIPDGEEDPARITTAMFYSITSTQKGLQGVDLGNYLIKKVVVELQQEFPRMNEFSSLSPIPGFKDWLIGELNQHIHRQKIGEDVEESACLLNPSEMESLSSLGQSSSGTPLEVLKNLITNHSWIQKEHIVHALKPVLMRQCARYLYVEKRRGYALNPVANFHLQNGAVLWRLNWMADMSIRGLSKSCGMMVNYRYYLDNTVSNSQQYIENQVIHTTEQFTNLCQSVPSVQQST